MAGRPNGAPGRSAEEPEEPERHWQRRRSSVSRAPVERRRSSVSRPGGDIAAAAAAAAAAANAAEQGGDDADSRNSSFRGGPLLSTRSAPASHAAPLGRSHSLSPGPGGGPGGSWRPSIQLVQPSFGPAGKDGRVAAAAAAASLRRRSISSPVVPPAAADAAPAEEQPQARRHSSVRLRRKESESGTGFGAWGENSGGGGAGAGAGGAAAHHAAVARRLSAALEAQLGSSPATSLRFHSQPPSGASLASRSPLYIPSNSPLAPVPPPAPWPSLTGPHAAHAPPPPGSGGLSYLGTTASSFSPPFAQVQAPAPPRVPLPPLPPQAFLPPLPPASPAYHIQAPAFGALPPPPLSPLPLQAALAR
eukprot:tig00000178_g12786.t1